MSLFSFKKESDVMLVLDIGSGSVGGSLVLKSKTHPPTILYTFRSEIPFQTEVGGTRLLSLMLLSLSQVLLAITHEGFSIAGFTSEPFRIREVVVSLSAPWVISKTSFLSLVNEKPMKITSQVVNELLRHSEKDAAAFEKDLPKGTVPIEQKLMKSILNGYATHSPYWKEAREAEFAVFVSFSVPRLIEKISDAISAVIYSARVSFHSFSFLAFSTLCGLYPQEENFMLVDVSGEQTELCIVKRGTLAETVTFPFGRNHLIRALKQGGDVPASGVPAIFKLHSEKNGVGPLFERCQEIIKTAEAQWQGAFAESISIFSGELFLPKLIFLTTDDDVALIFREALLLGDWSGFTLSPSLFQVVTVGSELLAPLVTWSLPDTRDPFLGLISTAS